MNAAIEAPGPSRRLVVYGALWVIANSVGWVTNGGALRNVISATLLLRGLARAMVRETRALRPRGMTLAAALWPICWFPVISPMLLRPLWGGSAWCCLARRGEAGRGAARWFGRSRRAHGRLTKR
jgi:hypothetical protein